MNAHAQALGLPGLLVKFNTYKLELLKNTLLILCWYYIQVKSDGNFRFISFFNPF